jgi:PhnB protein
MITRTAKAIPDGYHTITPYLIVRGAAEAIRFYGKAFGAVETMRIADPAGKVGHAEIKIGDSPVMLADEYPDMGARGPEAFGGSPVSLHLYVPDVDAMIGQALAAGARLKQAIEDKFYGDRAGSVTDPFGHVWHLATHKEDLTADELQRRSAALYGS